MFKKMKLVIYICFCVAFFGCENTPKSKQFSIVIGDVKVSYVEIEKEFVNYCDQFKNTENTPLPKVKAETWLKEYMDKLYLLAEAYNLGYNNNDEIEKKADLMEKFVISAQYGEYAESFIYNNIKVTEEEIDYAVKKYPNCYEIERFEFRNRNEMKEQLGNDTIIDSVEEFNKVAEDMKRKGYYFTTKVRYPFAYFPGLQTILDTLKENSISAPFIGHDGAYFYSVYVIYKKKLEDNCQVNISDYELRESLKSEIKRYKENSLFYDKLKSFLNNSNYKIYEELTNELFSNYNQCNCTNLISNEVIEGINEEVILEFTLNKQLYKVTVSELVFAENNSLFSGKAGSYKNFIGTILDGLFIIFPSTKTFL